MADSNEPPPGLREGFVAPPPVYGVEQPDGSIARARTVAEGAAAVRARVAAKAPLPGAPGWRRVGAILIDLALGIAFAAGASALRPMTVASLVAVALGATFFIRIVVATMAGGASPGRFAMGTRAVDQDATRLTLDQVAVREACVLVSVALSPLVALWTAMRFFPSEVSPSPPLDLLSIRSAPVPQDRATGTTVATVVEIDRVRGLTARRP